MDEYCTLLTLALPSVLPGIIVYYRKEGRALGEVTKYLVYNMRKRQEGESPRPDGPLLPPLLTYLVSVLCPRDSGSPVFFFLSVAAARLLPHSLGPFLIPIPPQTFSTLCLVFLRYVFNCLGFAFSLCRLYMEFRWRQGRRILQLHAACGRHHRHALSGKTRTKYRPCTSEQSILYACKSP